MLSGKTTYVRPTTYLKPRQYAVECEVLRTTLDTNALQCSVQYLLTELDSLQDRLLFVNGEVEKASQTTLQFQTQTPLDVQALLDSFNAREGLFSFQRNLKFMIEEYSRIIVNCINKEKRNEE